MRRTARPAAALAAVAALILTLAGCAISEQPGAEHERPAPTDAPPEQAPELVPGGSAEQNLPFFTQVLRQYAAGENPIEGRPLVDAVASFGFDMSTMQVSFDRTQTNLVADSIYLSVRIDDDCLIAQVITADRSLVTEVAPVVGPEPGYCLIGNTRPIDW